MSDKMPSRGFQGARTSDISAATRLPGYPLRPATTTTSNCRWRDNRTTREVAKVFREDYKIPRKSIKAQADWVA
jgi:hypothetical protein